MDIPIPMEPISRIEVLHGAGSTVYGSDAMGGPVNFVTSPARASELLCGQGVAIRDSIRSTSSRHSCFAGGRKQLPQTVISPQDLSLIVTIAAVPHPPRPGSSQISDKPT